MNIVFSLLFWQFSTGSEHASGIPYRLFLEVGVDLTILQYSFYVYYCAILVKNSQKLAHLYDIIEK